MSLDNSKQIIHCDGEDCSETTLPPIALRATLGHTEQDDQRASGWLFIVSQSGDFHFCPRCGPRYLTKLRSG